MHDPSSFILAEFRVPTKYARGLRHEFDQQQNNIRLIGTDAGETEKVSQNHLLQFPKVWSTKPSDYVKTLSKKYQQCNPGTDLGPSLS
jgi:hypothetical protein